MSGFELQNHEEINLTWKNSIANDYEWLGFPPPGVAPGHNYNWFSPPSGRFKEFMYYYLS